MSAQQVALFEAPPTELAAPFWEGIARRELRLPRCSECGQFQWYPDSTGPDCPGAEYEWTVVGTAATVYTMTKVHRWFLPAAVPEAADSPPFVVGVVELDDAPGVRLVAQLADEAGLAIGARVAARFDSVGDGLRLRFAPVAADAAADEPRRSTTDQPPTRSRS